jgi:subtilisin family serine protease
VRRVRLLRSDVFIFRVFLIAIISSFGFAGAFAAEIDGGATFATPTQNDYVPDEVLVILADDSNEGIGSIEQAIGGTVEKKISFPDHRRSKQNAGHLQSARQQVLRVKLSKGKSVLQTASEQWHRKNPRIVRVEPNYKVRLLAIPNDPLFTNLWALKNTGQTGGTPNADIDAVPAWDITTGSEDVIIAVIDTGIDYLHPDLAENIWTNPYEIPDNGIDDDHNGFIDDVHGYDFVKNDGDPMDEHSHGTHVSGTIGGRGNNGVGVTGINWQCRIMACRFLDKNGSGSIADAIDAVNYAVANGARILSNSWGGGGYSSAMAAAITNARDNGVLFVAAAGNDASDTDIYPNYPSCYPIENVIAVAATDDSDELAYFSNYGKTTVHLAAPGVSILSSVLNGGYTWYSGTSMATPHVSGVAALLLAHDPTMSVYELKSRLMWTGDPISSLGTKTVTGRRLNAYNALTAQPTLSVVAPNTQATWVRGFDWPIQWMSIVGTDTVNIFLLKGGIEYAQLANGVSNASRFTWHIPANLPAGTDYRIRVDDGVNTDDSDVNFTISATPADYFTQLFTSGFDLDNKSLLLTPDGSVSQYSACLKEITELPVDPAGGTNLGLADDDSQPVTLTGHSVRLYGTSYNTFYVGSNGYITFDAADIDYSESIATHLSLKRVSAFFRDLDPTTSGSVSVKELDDRAVVTWNAVPAYGHTTPNTFQVEMFYDGNIRLSWLSVAARSGLVGISEGIGLPLDFEQSDFSTYGQCRPLLTSIEVVGPNVVPEQSAAQFECVAHYEDGSTQDVTSADTGWGEDSNYAAIDNTGLMTSDEVNSSQHCTVTAAYDGKTDSHTLIIADSEIQNITIQKCTVRTGRAEGLDSIDCSGSFGAVAEMFDNTDSITVKIYSAGDDYLVYEQTIDRASFKKHRNIYSYTYRVPTGQPGGITYLRFDTGRNTFALKVRKADLTGLASPLYVIIDLGNYTAMGYADETVVNGRRLIPIRLMSGYADTLAVTKALLHSSTVLNNDQLFVKGTFTVDDDSNMTDGLTITWGSQTFIVPGDKFSPVGAYRLTGKSLPEGGPVINADFNFQTCAFTIKISKTAITPQYEPAGFGLTFGNYGKSDNPHP